MADFPEIRTPMVEAEEFEATSEHLDLGRRCAQLTENVLQYPLPTTAKGQWLRAKLRSCRALAIVLRSNGSSTVSLISRSISASTAFQSVMPGGPSADLLEGLR